MPSESTAPAEVIERDLPEPARLRKLIGPSVILVGVGVASGEYILFPYIASVAGLAFLWAAVVGVAQWVLAFAALANEQAARLSRANEALERLRSGAVRGAAVIDMSPLRSEA